MPLRPSRPNTQFVIAFDVESLGNVPGRPPCLEACQRILPVLQQAGVPATMFIVADLLEDPDRRRGFQELFKDDSIAIGSHSLTHRPVRMHPLRPHQHTDCAEWRRDAIIKSKKLLEDVFEKQCSGFRSPWSFPDGLPEVDLLTALKDSGSHWSSSRLWGPYTNLCAAGGGSPPPVLCTLPAPPIMPYTYAMLGFPDIVEYPSLGWHENVLKGYSFLEWGGCVPIMWPSSFPPGAIPAGFIKTPDEEIAVNRVFIDLSIEKKLPCCTFVWHSWSLLRFDPDMEMLAGTIEYARSRGMEFTTFECLYQAHRREAHLGL